MIGESKKTTVGEIFNKLYFSYFEKLFYFQAQWKINPNVCCQTGSLTPQANSKNLLETIFAWTQKYMNELFIYYKWTIFEKNFISHVRKNFGLKIFVRFETKKSSRIQIFITKQSFWNRQFERFNFYETYALKGLDNLFPIIWLISLRSSKFIVSLENLIICYIIFASTLLNGHMMNFSILPWWYPKS